MKPLLIVQHAAWEAPHRILRAFEGTPTVTVRPLDGQRLPPPARVSAGLIMGGPMNVDDTSSYPELADERRWIEEALQLGLPLLGICLGSQLIARVLGADVSPAPRPEIGWDTVEVFDPDDPLIGSLAPRTSVLHWHGDAFSTPPGATALARSEQTACQAFRHANAWGVLFHPEADRALIATWLAEPTMASEAAAALGDNAHDELLAGASRCEAELIARSGLGFRHFAELAGPRAPVRGEELSS